MKTQLSRRDWFKSTAALSGGLMVSTSMLDRLMAAPLSRAEKEYAIKNDSISGKIVHHSGGWPGYSTYIRRYLDRNDCIVVLTNNEGKGMRSAVLEIGKRLKRKMSGG